MGICGAPRGRCGGARGVGGGRGGRGGGRAGGVSSSQAQNNPDLMDGPGFYATQ